MSASFRAHIYRFYLLEYRYAVTMLFIATGFCKQERITYTLIEDMDGIYHLFQDASQDANNLFEAGRGSKTRSTFSRPGPYISKSQATFHSRHQYNFKTRSLFFKTRSLFFQDAKLFFKTRSFFFQDAKFFFKTRSLFFKTRSLFFQDAEPFFQDAGRKTHLADVQGQTWTCVQCKERVFKRVEVIL